MYRPLSSKPSGLLQHQPQRYSDRHLQQANSADKNQTSRPVTAQKHSGPKNSLEPGDTTHMSKPGDTTHISKPDDDQGIKSYLKKTHPSDDAREAKPDVNEQAEELKGADKQNL